jgi:SAM-dependent methyltransferase
MRKSLKTLKSVLRPLYRHFFPLDPLRRQIAARYLKGNGIEIGALHFPLKVPSGATVRYVDRMAADELRAQYPELDEAPLVAVDVIDDGEKLPQFKNATVDFVIANHMIEHCQSPIESIENWLRVLKPGGVLFMAVPDKRYTFDVHRAITPLGHVVRDYREGPHWSRSMHFREVVSGDANSDDTSRSEDEIAAAAQRLSDDDYSIHFHVWTQAEFLQLLLYCRHDLCFGFDIELFQKNGIEFIIVLRKAEHAADENAST